jgi:hypothetical protein
VALLSQIALQFIAVDGESPESSLCASRRHFAAVANGCRGGTNRRSAAINAMAHQADFQGAILTCIALKQRRHPVEESRRWLGPTATIAQLIAQLIGLKLASTADMEPLQSAVLDYRRLDNGRLLIECFS